MEENKTTQFPSTFYLRRLLPFAIISPRYVLALQSYFDQTQILKPSVKDAYQYFYDMIRLRLPSHSKKKYNIV